jgi:hypothetical protein
MPRTLPPKWPFVLRYTAIISGIATGFQVGKIFDRELPTGVSAESLVRPKNFIFKKPD